MEGRDEKGRFTEKNLWAYVMKEHNGRPRIYNTPEELLQKALEYFQWADDTQKGKYAEAHLRLWLGFSRFNWRDYKNNPEFSYVIDIIDSYLEGDSEQRLMWAGSTQGAIFKLKNKHGWKDEQHNNNTNTTINADFGQVVQSTQEPTQDTSGDK